MDARRIGLGLLLGISLTGCATFVPDDVVPLPSRHSVRTVTVVAPPADPTEPVAVPPRQRALALGRIPKPAGKPEIVGMPVFMVPDPNAGIPRALAAPIKLEGLNEDQAQAVLGKPQLVVERNPARVWKYVTQACELDLFFYPDIQTSTFYVLHVGVTKPQQGATDESECVLAVQAMSIKMRS